MEKEQISLSTSKLLKTIGFNLYTGLYYNKNGSKGAMSCEVFSHLVSIGYGDNLYPIVPQFLVNQWFREIHKIHILIDFKFNRNKIIKWYYKIYDLNNGELILNSNKYYNEYRDVNEYTIRRSVRYTRIRGNT